MTILSPSTLETVDDSASNWNAVNKSNFEKINTKLGHLMSATTVPGTVAVTDQGAPTQITITNSTGGTASATVNDVGATYSQSNINDALSSVLKELNAARTDRENLRAKVNELLAALRKSGGNGVLA